MSIDLSHSIPLLRLTEPAGAGPAGSRFYFFNNAHLLSESGVKAWSPGTVPISL
jgi:hypothetical protein